MNIIEHTNRYTCTNRIYETIYEKIWKMSKEWIPTWGSPQLSWAQTISFFPPPTSLIITPSIPFNMLSVSTCSFKISCSWCHQISSEKMTALVQWDSMSALWANPSKAHHHHHNYKHSCWQFAGLQAQYQLVAGRCVRVRGHNWCRAPLHSAGQALWGSTTIHWGSTEWSPHPGGTPTQA